MKNYLDFIERHAKAVIAVVFAISLAMLILTAHIVLNADYNMFMPWGDDTDWYEGGIPGQEVVLSEGGGEGEVPSADTLSFLLFVKDPELYTQEKLNLVSDAVERLISLGLSAPSSALDFITFEKAGSRLMTVPVSPDTDGEWTEQEAAVLSERILNDPIMPYLLVGGDRDSLVFTFQAPLDTGKEELEAFSQAVQPLKDAGITTIMHGDAVLNQKVFDYLKGDLIRLMTLSLIVILIVFFLCFHTKRSVLIPMSLSVISLIWTFGTMVLLGIDITLLNIVTPCMVITLGSAYSIHVLNEYFSGLAEFGHVDPIASTKRITKTIVLACITTIAGFLCLCISETQGLVDFGISVSAGIAYCAILACTYLPAVMIVIPEPKKKKVQAYKESHFGNAVNALARFVPSHWIILLMIFLAIIGGFLYVRDKIPLNSNYMSYFPEDDPFGQESRLFASQMGGTTPFQITISAEEDGFFLRPDNLRKVWEYEESIKESEDILQVLSFPSYVSFANLTMTGEEGIPSSSGLLNLLLRYVMIMKNSTEQAASLISDDGRSITLTIQNWDAEDGDLMTITSAKRVYEEIVSNLDLLPEGTKVAVHGYPVVSIKFSERLMRDMNLSTLLSLMIVFCLSLFTFRSIRSSILVLIPVGAGIMINYIFMFLMDIPFDIITVCFSSTVIGCGCDDAIHYMIRLRRSMDKHTEYSMKELIEKTISETGRPIILSTLSIVAGMMMLTFASYTPIRYFGMLMSVSLTGCMVSTLIFLPPAAILLDKIGYGIRSRRKRA